MTSPTNHSREPGQPVEDQLRAVFAAVAPQLHVPAPHDADVGHVGDVVSQLGLDERRRTIHRRPWARPVGVAAAAALVVIVLSGGAKPAAAATYYSLGCLTYPLPNGTLGYQADFYRQSNYITTGTDRYESVTRTTGTTSGSNNNNSCLYSTMTVEVNSVMDRLDSSYASLGLCDWDYTTDTDGYIEIGSVCNDSASTYHMKTSFSHRAWWWGTYYDASGNCTIEYY